MSAQVKVAVAGATGRLGQHVADVLAEQGAQVVPIARSRGVDVITGQGLAAALAGAEQIIDVATSPSPDQATATTFFTTAARNLHQAGQQAGVQRIITVSIIGTDRFTAGYSAAKIAHEQAMQAGPIPVQLVRAAQFYEFVGQLVDWGTRGDVAYVQEMRIQPVAARALAEALAGLSAAPLPADGQITQVAGPREESMVELATLLAARRGLPVKIEGVRDAADPDSELYVDGTLLPGPGAILTGPTYEEWLTATS